ncbi:hypothetical protein [Roseovarius sp. MMSF_3281]|uniref:hypothetical protein n=1 Tax=Roseovarius sp. MMSF_3281 TaxID=3046694 RepID=UPI00273EED2E|nr:hypothetical protein [Roseovarius sp. MMSF_3281]
MDLVPLVTWGDGVRVAAARDRWVREGYQMQGFTMALGLRTAGACARERQIGARAGPVKGAG